MDHRNFPAHIRAFPNLEIQSVCDHSTHTAEYAAEALTDVGLFSTSYLAGLLHDLGKMTTEYRDYLEKAAKDPNSVTKGSVNHTFAGVRYILENFHPIELSEESDEFQALTSEIEAVAVGSHHGLFDCIDENHHSGYTHRIQLDDALYKEAISNYFRYCYNADIIRDLFQKSVSEITAVVTKIQKMSENAETESEAMFYLGLLTRLVTSAVIEGDRRDTAEFMNDVKHPLITDKNSHIQLWKETLKRVETKLAEFKNEKEIDRARQTISKICGESALSRPGLYCLNVPTGGSKTLSSLRFALRHAATWNKSRIIFTSPLLSILEQNAAVIREFVQDDSIILEHHSNVINAIDTPEENLDFSELFIESWNAPIIITTLVQFLNTLFSGKTTCVRRFQALCNSIIVIDEVQSVPNNMLTLFNLAVNFLTDICGATVVLCSATQPCLEQTMHPIVRKPREIVPFDLNLWTVFKRTDIVETESLLLEEIPGLARKVLKETESLLIVCNKKSEAEKLFTELSDPDYACFHLSASMCVAHRQETVEKIKQALEQSCQGKQKTVCVSTQVIEAGVDISFASVIRLSAGMDSVVQAAGRCNRNSESNKPAPVYLVPCRDENLSYLKEIQRARDATAELLTEYRNNPQQFKNDLMSDTAIRSYYRRLYKNMPLEYQNFTVRNQGRTLTLFSLLSDNEKLYDADICPASEKYCLNQAFKTAGKLFTVFDNDTFDLIVPHGNGRDLIDEICAVNPQREPWKMKCLVKAARPYTVAVYDWQLKKLEAENAIVPLFNGKILILREEFYDDEIGLISSKNKMEFMEV